MTCEEGQFCALTIQRDYFDEPNDEDLKFSLDKITQNSWTRWSDMNATLYGVPASSGNLTAVVRATDEAGLTCSAEIKIIISPKGIL